MDHREVRCEPAPGGGRCWRRGARAAAAALSAAVLVSAAVVAAAAPPAVAADPAARLLTWGDNEFGQLGNGGYQEASTTPGRVSLNEDPDGATVIDVSAGFAHNLVRTSDLWVYAWGRNHYGQLGLGTTTDRYTPKAVAAIGSAWDIAAGSVHSLAVVDGTVYSWGRNYQGSLGNGTSGGRSSTTVPTPAPTAQPVPPLAAGTSFRSVAAGGSHSMALTTDGKVYAWGRNREGQVGYPTSETYSHTPMLVRGLDGIQVHTIAAGGTRSLAVAADGKVYAWGDGSNLPTPVAGFENTMVATAAAGETHSLAATTDGKVYAWGENAVGQLGNGGTEPSSTPVQVTGLDGVQVANIAAGDTHSLAVDLDGRMYAWGANYAGQLGNGATTPWGEPGSTTAVPVSRTGPAPDTPVSLALAAGMHHSLVGCQADGC